MRWQNSGVGMRRPLRYLRVFMKDAGKLLTVYHAPSSYGASLKGPYVRRMICS